MEKRDLRVSMTAWEVCLGWVYLIVYQLFLPSVLQIVNSLLPSPMSAGALNFLFFTINFISVAAIFHRFFWQSIKCLQWEPFITAAGLGLLIYFGASFLVTRLIVFLEPAFANVNDASIGAMLHQEYLMIAVGTILLAPPVEETLFRGLIFGRLYRKSRAAAYLLSVTLFSVIHVFGYIGAASPLTLALCFLQYIPAGVSLAWAYATADNIFAPITMHILINALGIALMR